MLESTTLPMAPVGVYRTEGRANAFRPPKRRSPSGEILVRGYNLSMITQTNLPRRFWDKVTFSDSCWIWNGAIDNHGYGRFRMNGKTLYAHRLSYEDQVGPFPKGCVSDHLCRTRACVRPSCIEPVTVAVNNLRGISPAAMCAKKTHCKNGHPFSIENTYINRSNGQRVCRTCHVEEMRRFRSRKRL